MSCQKIFIITLILFNCFIEIISFETSKYKNYEEYFDTNYNYTIYPLRYELTIQTNSYENDFNGTVLIDFISNQNTNFIQLDADYDNMYIYQIKLIENNNTIEEYTTSAFDETNTLTVITENELKKFTEYQLFIAFECALRNDYTGFFNLTYEIVDSNVTKSVPYTVTHLEDRNAFKVFPCFDNIIFKSYFKVHIIHNKYFYALSNGKSKRTENLENGMIKQSFEETPIMSIYLLAFIVFDFPETPKYTKKNARTILTYAEPDVIDSFLDAFNNTDNLIGQVEEYLNQSYFMPNMPEFKQVVISKFQSLAMENWGLIVYQFDAIAYNENYDAFERKLTPLSIIIHEISHQFFGNLVTPKSTKYIWLNEGFATYMERVILEREFNKNGKINYADFHLTKMTHRGFFIDSKGDNQSLIFPENTSFASVNHELNYKKGGAVIWMLNHVLSMETMQKVLQKYLNTNENKSVENSNLYKVLEEIVAEDNCLESGINITAVADSWVSQHGFPVLKVTLLGSMYGSISNDIQIIQERCTTTNDTDATWWLPYNYATKSNPNFSNTRPKGWLKNTKSKVIHVPHLDNSWIIFNLQQTGYYIVDYDNTLWTLIIDELNNGDFEKIHYLNRAQLIHDSYFLASIEQEEITIKYKNFFKLITYLPREKHHVPWMAVELALKQIRMQFFNNAEYKDKFTDFVHLLTKSLYNEFRLENQMNLQYELTALIVRNLACESKNKICKSDANIKATEIFNLSNNGSLIDPDSQQQQIYKLLLCHCDDKIFDIIWQKLEHKIPTIERLMIIKSLECHTNSDIFRKVFINRILINKPISYIRSNERHLIVMQMYLNLDKIIEFLNYVVNNNDNIYNLNDNELGKAFFRAARLMDSKTQFELWKDIVRTTSSTKNSSFIKDMASYFYPAD